MHNSRTWLVQRAQRDHRLSKGLCIFQDACDERDSRVATRARIAAVLSGGWALVIQQRTSKRAPVPPTLRQPSARSSLRSNRTPPRRFEPPKRQNARRGEKKIWGSLKASEARRCNVNVGAPSTSLRRAPRVWCDKKLCSSRSSGVLGFWRLIP